MRACFLVAAAAALAACSAPEYSSPAWSGRVVDIETGAPIEGAVVVVRWPVETFRAELGGWLVMDEAVTDRDGIFHFKAWGPLHTPDHRGSRTRLSPNVPSIDVFKSRYMIAVTSAGSEMSYMDDRSYTGPAVRKVYADEKVIALERFTGTDSKYRQYLESSLVLRGPLCDYQIVPRIYAAIAIESKRLAAATGSEIRNHSLEDMRTTRGEDKCPVGLLESIKKYL